MPEAIALQNMKLTAQMAEPSFDMAKIRILEAAETLFASANIESVSLREIAVRAGHGNTNAVQYHFGGREELVQAIFMWRMEQMAERRAADIAKAETENKANDLPTLIRILCLPYAELINSEGRHSYAAFMGQYLTRQRPHGIMHPADQGSGEPKSIQKLMRLLLACIDKPSHPTGDYRLGLSVLLFCNTLVLADNEGITQSDPAALQHYIETGLVMATAAFKAGIAV